MNKTFLSDVNVNIWTIYIFRLRASEDMYVGKNWVKGYKLKADNDTQSFLTSIYIRTEVTNN